MRWLALVAVGLVVGCGGGGGGDTSSPFAGTWAPTISDGALTIAGDGRFNMTLEDPSGGTESYSGRITDNGNVSGTATHTDFPGLVANVSGTATRNNASEITLNLTITNPDTGATNSAAETFTKVRGARPTIEHSGLTISDAARKTFQG